VCIERIAFGHFVPRPQGLTPNSVVPLPYSKLRDRPTIRHGQDGPRQKVGEDGGASILRYPGNCYCRCRYLSFLVRLELRAGSFGSSWTVANSICLFSLRDDDLAYIVRLNTKDLHKLVARLKEARFLCQFNRPELKDGQTRPVSRIYYFIDYRQAIDGIKWRVYTITKEIQGNSVPVSEKKEYFCPNCKAEWTQMEVLDRFSPQGFLCHTCDHPLVHDLERNTAGHEKATRLNNQFQFMTALLQQIDQTPIPANNFEVALSHARPVIRDAANPGVKSVPVDMNANRPTAVKGLTNVGPKSMAVNISTSDGPTEAERAAEQSRKEKIAQQNALPSWMSNSTVTGESFAGNNGPSLFPKQETADVKDPSLQASLTDRDHQAMDDILATLQAEQAQKDLEDEEEEYGSDEEDDEDFEDVLATENNSARATPASNTVPQPTFGMADPDGRPAKKVKVESPPAAVGGNDDEDESDEDVEFEDV